MSKPNSSSSTNTEQAASHSAHQGRREFIESVVIAIVLAFLFRAFEAEAFVIPTGSMAPTLMGRHKDVTCSQCGQPYQGSASHEEERGVPVLVTICPTCRFPMELDPAANANQRSFSGDRILVSKFAYELAEPQRWDVIVFKFPGNAKQNYIKRLIGLPGETVRIRHGDVYIKRPGETEFQIAQRGAEKIEAMLQLVHDNDHQSETLNEIGWPRRWRDESPSSIGDSARWQTSQDHRSFAVNAAEGQRSWLYYRHHRPSLSDWAAIESREPPPNLDNELGHLITDYYAYNNAYGPSGFGGRTDLNWVGDLAIEFDLKVNSPQGKFICELVKAGVRYQCVFDVAAGSAALTRSDGQPVFFAGGEEPVASVEATSPIAGPATHRIRMANTNDSLCVWVDGTPLTFAADSSVVRYQPPAVDQPQWSPADPGDLAPVRLAAEGMAAEVKSLQVLRDVYYVAVGRELPGHLQDDPFDYDYFNNDIEAILDTPARWASSGLFDSRRTVEFKVGDDEFFPLGDNSPQSSDGRLWPILPAPTAAVPRDLMIGKALLVYWPHTWNRPVPFTPYLTKMRLIK